MKLHTILVMFVIAGNCFLHAGIIYDTDSNTVWVVDYPKDSPATMADVMAADSKEGWRKVSYEQESDTYRIDASLKIGSDDGSNTYFRLGSPDHPREVLILTGNLIVAEAKMVGRCGNAFLSVNHFQAGELGNAQIRPAIRIDCRKRGEFTYKFGSGSRFHLYNATLTALTQDEKHMLGQPLTDGEVDWVGASLSWIITRSGYSMAPSQGIITPDRDPRSFKGEENEKLFGTSDLESVFRKSRVHRILNTSFGHGYNGLFSYSPLVIVRCAFHHLEHALMVGYKQTRATFIECEFDSNYIDIRKDEGFPTEITCINCRWNNPGKNGILAKGAKYTVKNQLVVFVVDEKENPIVAARVQVTGMNADAPPVENGGSITDEDGYTPLRGMDGGILATSRVVEGMGTGVEPKLSSYTYRIEVVKKGFEDKIVEHVVVETAWQEVKIVLSTNPH